MKHWALALILLAGSIRAWGQQTCFHSVTYWCEIGNTTASVANIPSSNFLQGSYPQCRVAVYYHNTQNATPLFRDGACTQPKDNAFTANTDGSFDFYVNQPNTDVDIVTSGGLPAPGFPVPKTIADVCIGCNGSGGGGGGAPPCGIINDVQLNQSVSPPVFGCDSAIFYADPIAHIVYDWYFDANKGLNILDTTNSFKETWGASNGTNITNTYSTGVNATLASTYGVAVPDNAPTQVNDVLSISSLTPVNGLLPSVWALASSVAPVYLEYEYPIDFTNGPFPTPCPGGDCVRTLFQQGQSQFLGGPGPLNIPSDYVIQAVTCGENSTGVFTCPMPSPVTPGNRLCALATTQCGLGCFNAFTFTDSLSNSFTGLDNLTWTHTPSSDACAPITVGGQDTITITPSLITTGTTQAQIVELTRTTSIDAHAAGDATTFTAGVVGNLTPVTSTVNNDFVLSWQTSQQTGSGAATFGAGIGGVLVNQANQANTTSIMSQGYIAGAAGVFTPTAYSNLSGGGVGAPGSTWPSFTIAFGATAPPTEAKPTYHSIWPYDILDSMMTGADVGVADAYNISFSHCPTTLTPLKSWAWFTPANANATTTPTLLWCGLGPHTITKNGQSALVANDMITTKISYMLWDGTDWELQNPATGGGTGVGFNLITSGTNTTATMTVGTGATITTSGSGINNANQFKGNTKIALSDGGTNVDLSATGSSTCNSSGLAVLKQNASHVVSSACLAAVDVPAALSSTTSVNGTTVPASATLTQTICSGTITAPNGSPVASSACSSAATTTCTGLATTDNIMLDFAADPTGTTGYIPGAMGTLVKYPTTNTINVKFCNNTGNSITPSSVTLNYLVVR